nr:reverse transcriptase domain-containing protein [Tanacetum cinerariifolium]
MRAVGQEVAYAMPWKTLKQMMTAKYCPRSEVKKLEVDLWNLKVKGTDISSYTHHFQELSLLCGRMFPGESDEIERYVGGLPEMIRGNVMSYEPKSMQKAIESANEQMDQLLIRIADRQADNKRKFDNNSRNQQNQQPFRRNNNVAQAYAAGSGEKPYRGTKPLEKLDQKLLRNQKCMGFLVHAYYSISCIRSKATEDIINTGSFVEVLGLNHYILVKKISRKLSKLQDEDAQNKTNIQEPRKLWWWKFKRC